MAKAFKELKCLMVMQELRQEDLADITGKSRSYITSRMTGKSPWDMDDVYAICEAMDIDYADIPLYFPPQGRTVIKNPFFKGA